MAEGLKITTVASSQISRSVRQAMFALYTRYYDAVTQADFEFDLASKNWVLLLYAADTLVGFSTVDAQSLTYEGREILEIFSGDTVIAPEHWGTQLLSKGFAQLAGTLAARHPSASVYWLLISKGYRTWRYLPLFAREYWPNHTLPTPMLQKKLQDYLAIRRFGSNYNAEQGVVRFELSRGHLQAELSGVRENLLQKPEVRFFLEKNPNYAQGDELVCLTRLHADNLRGVVLHGFNDGWQTETHKHPLGELAK